MSKQDRRTKQQLLDENRELRRRVAELEPSEAMQREAETIGGDTQARYRRILESVADYIYTVSVENGQPANTTHGPACVAITGYTHEEFDADPYLWFRMVDERDRQNVADQARRILAGGPVTPLEHRIIRKDGAVRWVSNTPVLHCDAQGRLESYDGIIRDVTERKQAEEELRSREVKLRSVFLAAPVGIGMVVNRVIQEANDRLCDMIGYRREELLGRNARILYPTERDYEYVGRVKYELIQKQGTGTVETQWRRKDGSIIDIVLSSTPLDFNDLSAGVTFTALDVTERKRAEEALRESETRFRLMADHAPVMIGMTDETGRIIYFNKTWLEFRGVTLDQDAGEGWTFSLHPEDRNRVVNAFENATRLKQPVSVEYRIRRADGQYRWVLDSAVPRYTPDGRFLGHVGSAIDITERKLAEETLRESERRFRRIVEEMPVMMDAFDDRGVIVAWNRECERVTGYAATEMVNNPKAMEMMYPDPTYRRAVIQQAEQLADHFRNIESTLTCKNGEKRTILWSNISAQCPIPGWRFWAVGVDITDRRRIEESLQLTQFSVDHASDAAFWLGPDARFLYVSEMACRSLGYTRDELLNLSVPDIDPNFPQERWPNHWQEIRQRKSFSFETVHRRKDGSVFPVELTVNHLDFGGKEYNFAFARDLTDRKRAEEERRRWEAQIQHAQKLESLGVLAGGIAHDFNNLLTAILGHADLALTEMSVESPGRASLAEIAKASYRAADLCRQMLAYAGKGRFVVEPINVTRVVEEMTHILEISISKKATIKYHSEANLPAIEADATQIRQVVMNLIVNASEALGDRPGVISVSTGVMDCDPKYLAGTYLGEQLQEGRYVFLEVADTGCGMDRETAGRVFDPFFTTKFAGRGLGLAAVLGIVRGHKGAIKVYSEPHRGTTFQILFPASDRTASEARRKSLSVETWTGRGSLLIVDDEEPVRTIARRMAEHVGFTVLAASNGREAIEVFRKHRKDIVCVLLDLTMPQMDGEETFRKLKSIHPGVRAILSSGYSEHDLAGRFAGKGFSGFIQKPYQLNTLIERLKEATRQ